VSSIKNFQPYRLHQCFQYLPFLYYVLFLSVIFLPLDSFAIHAILKEGEAVPRSYGELRLGMSLDTFLEISGKMEEEAPAIGQFSDEHRYRVEPRLSTPDVFSVICDFYRGVLFRIELNYHPIKAEDATIQSLIDQWTGRFGEPRVNTFPEALLVFWDDGATRMILQSDESDGEIVYSVTYIDDDLFHAISRERVQRETSGRSNYGKK
jgi:hypothetical protein